jgi:hypothetical protein
MAAETRRQHHRQIIYGIEYQQGRDGKRPRRQPGIIKFSGKQRRKADELHLNANPSPPSEPDRGHLLGSDGRLGMDA